MSEEKPKTGLEDFNPLTGFKERELDSNIYKLDFFKFAKPKGPRLFERTHVAAEWIKAQQKAGMWLYNRAMLTGPSTEVLGTRLADTQPSTTPTM